MKRSRSSSWTTIATSAGSSASSCARGLRGLRRPNGKAGLRELYASPPDLVLLDVSMPELDGWQTLERIRDVSEVPVVMLTARAAELEKVRGLKAGPTTT